jgi:tRNA(Ile)-lysidine synthase
MTLLFEQKLIIKLNKYKNKKLLIAYSGGKDSTALLHFLFEYKNDYNYNILPVYINHNIRENIQDDIAHCDNFCKKLELSLIVESIDTMQYVNAHGESIEEAARILRYNALQKIKNKYLCDYILVAHNFNDQIENFFIKIFRGTSIYRLKGFNNSIADRPMLSISVNEILEYLEKYKLTYIVDNTNFDNNYLRNWVRNVLVKKIEEKNNSFLHKIAILQEESDILNKYMETRVKIPYEKNNGIIKIIKEEFLKLNEIERRFFLSQLIPLYISRNVLSEIEKILKSKNSKRINIQGGYIFEKSFTYIYIYKKELINYFNVYKQENSEVVEIKHLNKRVYFDRSLKNKTLILRNRKTGDRFLGKKLKDLFIDKKIDLFKRDTSVIVEDSRNILWVEHLCDNNEIKVVEQ